MSDAGFAVPFGTGLQTQQVGRIEGDARTFVTGPAVAQEHQKQWALEDERDRYRSALQQIASADLKRCSAGRLRDIAKKALGETP